MPAVLEARVIQGKGLKNVQTFGKQDPYCKAFLSTQEPWQSKTITDGGSDPVWNQLAQFKLGPGDRILRMEVWNANVLTADVLIGTAKVELDEAKAVGRSKITAVVYDGKSRRAGTLEIVLTVHGNLNQTGQAPSTSSATPYPMASPTPYGQAPSYNASAPLATSNPYAQTPTYNASSPLAPSDPAGAYPNYSAPLTANEPSYPAVAAPAYPATASTAYPSPSNQPGYPGAASASTTGYPGLTPTNTSAYPGAAPTNTAGYPGAAPANTAAYPGAAPANTTAYPGAAPANTTGYPGAASTNATGYPGAAPANAADYPGAASANATGYPGAAPTNNSAYPDVAPANKTGYPSAAPGTSTGYPGAAPANNSVYPGATSANTTGYPNAAAPNRYAGGPAPSAPPLPSDSSFPSNNTGTQPGGGYTMPSQYNTAGLAQAPHNTAYPTQYGHTPSGQTTAAQTFVTAPAPKFFGINIGKVVDAAMKMSNPQNSHSGSSYPFASSSSAQPHAMTYQPPAKIQDHGPAPAGYPKPRELDDDAQ